jgi:predicted membrane protein
VGDAAVDLRQVTLTELVTRMGVGRTTVTLPEQGTFEARLDSAVGEIVVRVPAGLPVRVHSSTGLGTVSVPSSYQRDGDTYVSPGYLSAENRVELWVENGIGLIRVEEYQGE